MTRDQIVEVSKKAARRVAVPKSGTPASEKRIKRLAELKKKRTTLTLRANAGEYRARLRV